MSDDSEDESPSPSSVARHKRKLVRWLLADRVAVDALMSKTMSKSVVNQVAAYLDSWKLNLGKLSKVDDRLCELLEAQTEKSAAQKAKEEEAILKDYETYRSDLNKYIGEWKTARDTLISPPSTPRSGRKSYISASYLESTLTNPLVKLQDMPVPEFDGNIENFHDWYSEFESMIDKNENFDDFQKMYLLRRCMVGDAKMLIKDYGARGEAYPSALDHIKLSYDNRRRIIAEHFGSLLDMPHIKPTALRESLDKIQRIIRGLKVCKINVDHLSPFVTFVVARKLPENLRIEWENSVIDFSTYPNYELMHTFLSNRCFAYETSTSSSSVSSKDAKDGKSQIGSSSKLSNKNSKPTNTSSVPEKKSFAANKSSFTPPKCVVCNNAHFLNQCSVFINKPVNERFDIVKANRLCLKCFNPHHSMSTCKRSNCTTCGGSHNNLLHRTYVNSSVPTPVGKTESNNSSSSSNINTVQTNVPNGSQVPSTTTSLCALSTNKSVLLSTAVVKVQGNLGIEMGRVLFDQGSETTLITRNFCNRARLNIKKSKVTTNLIGINDKSIPLNSSVRCVLKSRFSDFSISVEAEIIDKIPYKVSRQNFTTISNQCPYKLAECFDLPYDDVDILLGNEYVEFVMAEKRHFLEGICLRESYFGYVVSGSINRSSFFAEKITFCGLTNSDLSAQFKRFVSLDEVTENSKLEKIVEHQLIEEHFEKTYSIDKNTGKFIVRLPIKPSIINLRGSFNTVRTMYLKSERRRSETLHNDYCNFFREYENSKHMSKISNIPDPKAYFIPHHIVSKDGISSRIVFNASFVDDSGTSLNDHLMQGPVLQPELSTNVNQFREHLVAICADVARMYRCIWVHPDDRIYQQILFRYSFDQPLDLFELNTLVNGEGPASYIATKCLEKVGDSIETCNPIAAKSIREHCYMDNWMSGANTVEKAIELRETVHSTLNKFGFPLRKYQSNSRDFLKSIDNELIEPLKQRNLGGNSFIHVLGLLWNPETDTLSVNIKLDTLPEVLTKRVVLADISKLFDLLGMLAPVTIRAKILLQDLWKESLGWDDPVSEKIKSEFLTYREQLPRLTEYSIPRCYYYSSEILSKNLIGFCDASMKAFCAVIYLRSVDSNGNIAMSFVCSKSRVAPIKPIHIHRLELMAAHLLATLVNRIGNELAISKENWYLFSDSQVSLSWINIDPLKLKQFVSNRVEKIVSLTMKDHWYYIKTSSNPADLATRGILDNVLLISEIWKTGPWWLLDDNSFENYITGKFESDLNISELPEVINEKVSFIIFSSKPILSILNNCSSFSKSISIVGYILRFGRNLKARIVDKKKNIIVKKELKPFCDVHWLSIIERDVAFNLILSNTQLEYFENEYNDLLNGKPIDKKSKLLSLNVFLDSNKLIRVGGRLLDTAFSYDVKHPIIIPAKSRFLELFVEQVHRKYYHASKSFIINFVRAKFWIVGNLIALVKKVVNRCVTCIRFNGKQMEQFMGNLPPERSSIGKPFTTTGVDLTGAITIKCTNHRVGKLIKVYIAFFICFTTRAVHLELLEDLTSEAFLNALERFVSSYGLPQLLYSDNATNFIGARNILEKLKIQQEEDPLNRYLVINHIEWKTIAPRTPHQGGLWEAAVKSGKSYLMKAIGAQTLNIIELLNIMSKIKAILNSRPIAYRKLNSFSEPLTPGHFLIGESLLDIPSPITNDSCGNLKERYFLWRGIIDSFWKVWRRNYLSQLQCRNKWKFKNRNLLVGDVVILIHKLEKVMYWPLAIVVKTFPDQEGIVRNCEVRLADGSVRRTSIQNLVYLPVNEN